MRSNLVSKLIQRHSYSLEALLLTTGYSWRQFHSVKPTGVRLGFGIDVFVCCCNE